MPAKLETVVSNMMNTQILDFEMGDNTTKDDLLPSLRGACRDKVPSGTMHLEMAEKELNGEDHVRSDHGDLQDVTTQDPILSEDSRDMEPIQCFANSESKKRSLCGFCRVHKPPFS